MFGEITRIISLVGLSQSQRLEMLWEKALKRFPSAAFDCPVFFNEPDKDEWKIRVLTYSLVAIAKFDDLAVDIDNISLDERVIYCLMLAYLAYCRGEDWSTGYISSVDFANIFDSTMNPNVEDSIDFMVAFFTPPKSFNQMKVYVAFTAGVIGFCRMRKVEVFTPDPAFKASDFDPVKAYHSFLCENSVIAARLRMAGVEPALEGGMAYAHSYLAWDAARSRNLAAV